MSEFVASNGAVIGRNREQLEVTGDTYYEWINLEAEKALREFIQHERDEELGRWRWQANPDYVVYPLDEHGQTVVLCESTGHNITFLRGQVNKHGSDYAQCALAFFEAHPQRKPWHEALIGELWAVTIRDVEHVAKVVSPRDGISSDGPEAAFLALDVETPDWVYRESPWITAGRRIWPEDAS